MKGLTDSQMAYAQGYYVVMDKMADRLKVLRRILVEYREVIAEMDKQIRALEEDK